MARYNHWINESLYAHAAALTDEQRKRDVGAFFGSPRDERRRVVKRGDTSVRERAH